MNDTSIRFQNLYVNARKTTILTDISAEIGQGEITAIIGPNGSGKTTLLRVINGFMKPSSGKAYVFGCDVSSISGGGLAALRKRIACVTQFEDYDSRVPISAREVAEFGRVGIRGPGRRLNEDDRRIVRRWLERLGVDHLTRRLYRDLSGGEKRKIQFARAMAQQADILLLDEPTSNLDPLWQLELSDIVEAVHRETGITIVLVTHEMHLMPTGARKVMLLSGGRLLAQGSPETVIRDDVLSEAYRTPVEVVERGDRRHVLIGTNVNDGKETAHAR